MVILEVLLDLLYGPGQPLELPEGPGQSGGENHQTRRLGRAWLDVVKPTVEFVSVSLQDGDGPGVVSPVRQVSSSHCRSVLEKDLAQPLVTGLTPSHVLQRTVQSVVSLYQLLNVADQLIVLAIRQSRGTQVILFLPRN